MSTAPNSNHDIIPANEPDIVQIPVPEQSNLRYEYEERPRGCGCVPIWVATLGTGLVIILAVMILGFLFFSDTRDKIAGGLNVNVPCVLNCGDEVTTIEEGPVLIALENTSWHEGTFANRNYPQMEASKNWPASWLTGTRSLKLNAIVKVTAGVDFELIQDWESAVEFENDELTITIPPPQIRDCILLEKQSTFYDYSCKFAGVISSCNDLEDALRVQVLKSSANDNYETVLNDAFENVEDFLEELILGVNPDIRRVYIVMDTDLDIMTHSEEGTCIDYATNPQSIWDVVQQNAQ